MPKDRAAIAAKRRAGLRGIAKAVRKGVSDFAPDVAPTDRDLMAEATDAEKRTWLWAQKAALDLHERMETLISRAFVVARLGDVIRIIRDAFERMPARLAHDLAAERDPAKVRAVLEKEITSALHHAADALEKPDVEADVVAATGPRSASRPKLR